MSRVFGTMFGMSFPVGASVQFLFLWHVLMGIKENLSQTKVKTNKRSRTSEMFHNCTLNK